MKKYFWAFKLSFSNQLAYRVNFLLGRLRSIIVLLILYYLWTTLTAYTGRFAGYTREELMTYVFGVVMLRAFVFGSQSRRIAQEINDGGFTAYLVKPINHFVFFYFRELAERLLLIFSSVIEITIVSALLSVHFFVQTDGIALISVLGAILGAHFLYYVLSYAVSLIAFWSREAMGPRFMFEWLLEFASGAYFPLTIVSAFFFGILQLLPFTHLIFTPLTIYLEKIAPAKIPALIGMQMLWILIVGIVATLVWKRGLRRYSGEGI